MSAVLGGDPAEVAEVLERHGLTAANANGAGQTVAAGTLEQLAALAADPPAKARVIAAPGGRRLPHRSTCRPAVDALSGLAAGFDVSDPGVTLLSNADGQPVAVRARRRSTASSPRCSSPVRWDLCMETLVADARRHRPRRAAPGRHPRRARQARACPESPHWRSRRPTTSRRHASSLGEHAGSDPASTHVHPDRRARGLT